MARLYSASIDGSAGDDILRKLLPALAALQPERAARAMRAASDDERRRRVLSSALPLWMAMHMAGQDPQKARYAYGAKGKPAFAGLPGFHFNVSHSGRWVLAACAGSDIGVDIERIARFDGVGRAGRAAPDVSAIARRFFHPIEADAILERCRGERRPAAARHLFIRIWTLKESFVKCVGLGMSLALGSFGFSFVGDAPVLRLEHEAQAALEALEAPGKVIRAPSFHEIRVDSGHAASLCCLEEYDGAMRVQSADALACDLSEAYAL